MAINLNIADAVLTQTDNTATPTITITAPNNIVEGDVILICASIIGDNAFDGWDFENLPTGFSSLQQAQDNNNWSPEIAIFAKVATASEPASYAFGIEDDWDVAAYALRVSGVDTSSIQANGESATTIGGTSLTFGSGDSTTSGNKIVYATALGQFPSPGANQGTGITPPSGVTKELEWQGDAGTDNAERIVLGVFSEDAATETIGTREFTWTNSDNAHGVWVELNEAQGTFENTSPEDGATGVSVTPTLEINNPDNFTDLNYRVATSSNVDADVIRDIFNQADTAAIAEALTASTQYHWNAREYTPGGQTTAFVYQQDFESGTPLEDFSETTLTGTSSVSVVGGDLVVESDPDGRVGVLRNQRFGNVKILLKNVSFTDVSTDMQPTFHFGVQGTTWSNTFIPSYYLYFIGGELRIGRVDENGGVSDYTSENIAYSRTAATDYDVEILKEEYRIRIAIWESSGNKSGYQFDYTDTANRYLSGGIAFKNAVVSGASAAQSFSIGAIEVIGAEFVDVTQSVDSVSVSPSSIEMGADETAVSVGTVNVSGDASTAGTWSKVSGDADITLQSTSGNTATFATSATVSDNDSAIFEFEANDDATKTAQVTVTANINTSVTGSRSGDEQALVDLYANTNGPDWFNSTGWSDTSMSLDDDIWGVGVDTIGGELRVVHLDLQRGTQTRPTPFSDPTSPFPGNNIEGSLPSSFGNLTEITYCNLKQNFFTGNLPLSMSNWTKCERLLIAGHTREPELGRYNHPYGGGVSGQSKVIYTTNNFGGTLPDIFSSMTSLKVFESNLLAADGRNNTFPDRGWQGAIPDMPTSLEMLFLGQNNLDSIPSSLGNADLKVAHFFGNQFTGSLPTFFGNWLNMTHLRIGDNGFSGSIPSEWSGFNSLQLLLMEKNNLSGSLPSFMFDGRNNWTEGLRVEFNSFTGQIPQSVNPADYPNWNVFSLGQNGFTGSIPSWITELRWIQLNLDNNDFSGDLPSGFHDDNANMYQRMRNLRLNNNSLTGNTPQANPGPDIYLWHVHNNSFTGTLTSKLGDTTSTRDVRIEANDNQLSGTVPTNIANIANLDHLYLNNNKFTSSDLSGIAAAVDPSVDYRDGGQNP